MPYRVKLAFGSAAGQYLSIEKLRFPFRLALVPALGGRMNLVLVVMPALIFVLSLSAGIHVVNYYCDAVSQSGTAGAPLTAIRNGWLPCALAAGTTAIGLASLAVSHVIPVRDFGKYSSIGMHD